jgi:hypothetical protein
MDSLGQYEGLKPGLYLQVGAELKAVRTQDGYMSNWGEFGDWLTDYHGRPSLESLVEQVAWQYVAISKRKQQLLEIPYGWMRGEEESEVPPFEMPFKEHLQQVDHSLQVYGEAFLHKRRNIGGMFGVRWLDPNTIEPDYETADDDGVKQYLRLLDNGQKIPLPAEDVVYFAIPGMRELRPGASPANAARLSAQIMRGIDQTASTLYKNNALPVMLVKVGVGTSQPERERTENFFKRLFNRNKGTNEIRTVAVAGEVEVETLSYAPKDLDQSPLTEQQVETILATHDVPLSVVKSDAENFATAIASLRGFVSAIGARFDYISDVYNEDPDFMGAGFTLQVRTQDHYAMKEDEAQRAEAAFNYTQAGATKEEAYFLVGIDPEEFPDWVVEAIEKAEEEAEEPEPMPQQFPPSQPIAEQEAEARSFKNWLKKRDNPDPSDFEAYYLTDDEKGVIFQQVKGQEASTTATWDDVTLVLSEFRFWAEEHAPDIAGLMDSEVISANGHRVVD